MTGYAEWVICFLDVDHPFQIPDVPSVGQAMVLFHSCMNTDIT